MLLQSAVEEIKFNIYKLICYQLENSTIEGQKNVVISSYDAINVFQEIIKKMLMIN